MGRVNPVVEALLARSRRLGADPRVTNYAGGNTSAKGTDTDPVTGVDVELMWVKGSGGDLGTLTEAGLATLRLDRLRALADVYPGEDREDEMVAAFDFCLHGRGGAVPSIDTAMHGLLTAPHVDHLHPDAGIAIAAAADGERLTKDIFGDAVVWIPWRRPGFQLGLDIAAVPRTSPQAVGCILGGHGITAWGATSDEAEANSRWMIDTAQAYIDAHGDAEPFGPEVEGRRARPDGRATQDRRRARTAAARDRLARPAHDRPLHRLGRGPRLPEPREARRPRRARHVVSRPLPADQGEAAPGRGRCRRRRARRAPPAVPGRLHRLLRTARDSGRAPDARRRPRDHPGTRHRDVLLRRRQADRARRRRVLRERDQRDARGRGTLELLPHLRVREVPDRVLGAGSRQVGAPATAPPPRRTHRAGDRSRERHRPRDRDAARRRRGVRRGRRPRRRARGRRGGGDRVHRRRGGSGRRRRRCRRRAQGRRRDAARLRRHRPRGEQRRPLGLDATARDHRARLGRAAPRDGQGELPRRTGRERG